MERAVIELFDALRPAVEPYFLQSNRIFQRQPPIIREMVRRGFSLELLPDKTDWEPLAKPKSFKHLCQMIAASVRCNIGIFKGYAVRMCFTFQASAWGPVLCWQPSIAGSPGEG